MQRVINRSAFALLADERERRALSLHGTARSVIIIRASPLQSHLAAWLFPLKPKA